jgi:putative transposase
MDKSQAIRTGRHCVFALQAHLVFVTKYRRGVFDAEAIELLRGYFTRVCEKAEVKLIEMNGEDDHVHLLIEYAPNLQLSTLVNSLRGASSRMLRKDRPDIAERYYKDVLWSPSYFAVSCGGAPLSVIKQYIEQQRTPTT